MSDIHLIASQWEKARDHALRHPAGWTIPRYKAGDVRVYLLWSRATTATTIVGMEKYGPVVPADAADAADAAKERHAGWTRANHG